MNEVTEHEFYTYDDLYKTLLINEEIIIVIEAIEEARLRRRLSVLKSKDAARMKKEGMEPEAIKLEFINIEDKNLKQGLIKLQILMKDSKPKIKIFSLTVAEEGLT